MKTRKYSMVAALAALLALLMSGAATTGVAQVPQQQEGMSGMSGMMEGPHHVLAMAYRENLTIFARTLQAEDTAKAVNLDLARPAVVEMRRSYDLMRQHHQAQMSMMGGHTDPAMSGMEQGMETHLTALAEHLTALESEVNAAVPDPKKVSKHTTAILEQCAKMSGMHDSAEPHPMK